MAASSCPPSMAVLKKNLIINCFNILRKGEQFVKNGGSKTNYEAFWDKLNHGFSLSLKPFKPTNSSVEAFYRGTLPLDQFLFDVEENVIKKALDKLDSNLDPLLTISWDVFCSQTFHKDLCERVSRLCGRQLWAIYNKLDIESTGFVDINDITEIILKIFYSNGRREDARNIHEWFCEQPQVDFWSFFSALVQNHGHLLQLHVIQELYEEVVHEILKQGKMTKKGHKVQTWKERWFILTSTNLHYYESLENRIQKGVITINSNTKVMNIPSIKGRNYLFQVTDGVTNRPYDISAPDPQVLKDWVETVQVVVAAQSIQGRNLLHRLSIARNNLFPTHVSQLPSYTPTTTSDYNEGIYRVVRPTSPISQPTPPPTTSYSPPSTSVNSPTRKTPGGSPFNGLSPTSSSSSISPQAVENMLLLQQKKQGPPVAPYQKTNSSSKIEHVNVDGHDYALVDKLLEDGEDETPPPVPKPLKGPPPEVKPYTPKPTRVVESESSQAPPPPLPKSREKKISNNDAPPPPLPKPKDSRPFSPISGSQYTEGLPQVLPKEEPRPAPKPRNKVGPTKSVPYISSQGGDYAQLSFLNTESSSPPNDDVTNKPVQIQQPKITSSAAKMKYDYSDVILTPIVKKDIDKAQELKASKPAPPLPPPKYDSSSVKRKSLSDLSLPLLPTNETSPTISTTRPHTYQNVHYTGGVNNEREEEEEEEEEAPPPPVPRRMESANRTESTDHLSIPPSSLTSPTTAPVPPRSPRRGPPGPSLPPLPPR